MKPHSAKESARTLPKRWIEDEWGTAADLPTLQRHRCRQADHLSGKIRPGSAPSARRKSGPCVYHIYTGRRVSAGLPQRPPPRRRPLQGGMNGTDRCGTMGATMFARRESWGQGGHAFAAKGLGPQLEPPCPSKGPTKSRWPTRSVEASVLRYIGSVRQAKAVEGNAFATAITPAAMASPRSTEKSALSPVTGGMRGVPSSVAATTTTAWPEHGLLERGDVVVTVEHCHSCHAHDMTTRHDPEVYLRHANAVKELLVDGLKKRHDLDTSSPRIRLAVVLKPANLRPKARRDVRSGSGGRGGGIAQLRRVGAFEVQVAALHPSGAGPLQEQVVHSKLATGRWPPLAHDGLATRVKQALGSWGFPVDSRGSSSGGRDHRDGGGGDGDDHKKLPMPLKNRRERPQIHWEFDNREAVTVDCISAVAAGRPADIDADHELTTASTKDASEDRWSDARRNSGWTSRQDDNDDNGLTRCSDIDESKRSTRQAEKIITGDVEDDCRKDGDDVHTEETITRKSESESVNGNSAPGMGPAYPDPATDSESPLTALSPCGAPTAEASPLPFKLPESPTPDKPPTIHPPLPLPSVPVVSTSSDHPGTPEVRMPPTTQANPTTRATPAPPVTPAPPATSATLATAALSSTALISTTPETLTVPRSQTASIPDAASHPAAESDECQKAPAIAPGTIVASGSAAPPSVATTAGHPTTLAETPCRIDAVRAVEETGGDHKSSDGEAAGSSDRGFLATADSGLGVDGVIDDRRHRRDGARDVSYFGGDCAFRREGGFAVDGGDDTGGGDVGEGDSDRTANAVSGGELGDGGRAPKLLGEMQIDCASDVASVVSIITDDRDIGDSRSDSNHKVHVNGGNDFDIPDDVYLEKRNTCVPDSRSISSAQVVENKALRQLEGCDTATSVKSCEIEGGRKQSLCSDLDVVVDEYDASVASIAGTADADTRQNERDTGKRRRDPTRADDGLLIRRSGATSPAGALEMAEQQLVPPSDHEHGIDDDNVGVDDERECSKVGGMGDESVEGEGDISLARGSPRERDEYAFDFASQGSSMISDSDDIAAAASNIQPSEARSSNGSVSAGGASAVAGEVGQLSSGDTQNEDDEYGDDFDDFDDSED